MWQTRETLKPTVEVPMKILLVILISLFLYFALTRTKFYIGYDETEYEKADWGILIQK